MRNCPDVTILINLFGQNQSQGALGGHGGQGGHGTQVGRGGWGGGYLTVPGGYLNKGDLLCCSE